MNEWTPPNKGCIEVICGSMFSGKTVELQRRLRRAQIAKQKVAAFKPALDTRYAKDKLVSHDSSSLSAVPVTDPKEIKELSQQADVIGIDEAQFFSESLVELCEDLANNGKRVIVSGLDIDSFGKPFGPMPILMAKAEFLTKLHAICTHCGSLAHYSYRISDDRSQIALGTEKEYLALCRSCYNQATSK